MRVIGGPHDGEWRPKTDPEQRWLTLAVEYHGPPDRVQSHLPTSQQYRIIEHEVLGEPISCWMPAHWKAQKCIQVLRERVRMAWREKVERGWSLPDDRQKGRADDQ